MRRRAAVLTLSAVALAVGACTLEEPSPDIRFEQIAVQGLWLEGFLALIALAAASLLPGGARARLGLGPGRLGAPQIAVLAIGTLGASSALDGLLDLTQWRSESALADFEAILAGVRGRSLVLGVVAFALMPGIAEELLCRGLVQRILVARLGAAAGIAIASVVFGALHLDPIHALFAAPLGLYLGLVCWLSDGIRASVLCHIVNNLVALLAGALLPASEAPAWPSMVAGTAVATAALAWVWRRAGPPPPVAARGGPGEPPEPDLPPPENTL
jgi:membrane protease YdiL (CAAX protease family)